MTIKEITNKQKWEKNILQISECPYFQAWNWGEIEQSWGRRVWRIGLFSNPKRIIGLSQIVKVEARRGTFLHVRHGPVLEKWNKHTFSNWLDLVVSLGKQENAWFVRISPLIEPKMRSFLNFFEFRTSPIHSMDAELVSVIDIKQSEKDLLKNMRKNTRNLIKRAVREGVIVKQCSINKFMKLYIETASRHGFVPHKQIYEEYKIFKNDRKAELYGAYHKGKLLSSALIVYYGKQALYRHGASHYSKVPASYILQWEMIKRAKRNGIKEYNLYGITNSKKKSHPWSGLTFFKNGFGGQSRQFLHAHDLPLTPTYYITYAIERLRKIKRGY